MPATDRLQSSFWTKRLVDVSPRPVGQKSTPSCFVVDLEQEGVEDDCQSRSVAE